MKIGEVSERTTVPTKTIRYWESQGLVADPVRTAAGYRDYDGDAVERVRFIRRCQAAGLTLAQIGQILDVADDGVPPCEHVAAAVDERLAEVEARIDELRATRRHLRSLQERAAGQDPADCEGYCSIIAGGS